MFYLSIILLDISNNLSNLYNAYLPVHDGGGEETSIPMTGIPCNKNVEKGNLITIAGVTLSGSLPPSSP